MENFGRVRWGRLVRIKALLRRPGIARAMACAGYTRVWICVESCVQDHRAVAEIRCSALPKASSHPFEFINKSR